MTTPTNDDKLYDLFQALTGMGLVGLIVAAIIVSSLRLADGLGPRIGDIIKFDPSKKISPDLQEPITTASIGGVTTVSCVLDPRIMLASGGSLVINAKQSKPNGTFRVDWAGTRTSDSQRDCGANAELLLSKSDIVTLMLAAGR